MHSNPAPAGVTRIAAALDATTETLAAEIGEPRPAPPRWTEFEWRIATAASALQGISPLLRAVLRWRGPQSWEEFLDEQAEQGSVRHTASRAVLDGIDRAAGAAGIPLVALKGAALYACGFYAAGLRPMGDIDLLVKPEQRAALRPILAACGYVPAFVNRRHDVYRPEAARVPREHRLGEHADNPLKIEVHTHIAEALPLRPIDVSHLIWPSCAGPGINPYASDTALLAHLLLHAAGNMRARALRHIQLHDIALVASRLTPDDWDTAFERDVLGWWAMPPLRLAARYHVRAIPEPVLARIEPYCTKRLLRHAARARISDVSWSKIRIEAFPGMEWSRSAGEACRLMASRVMPSRLALRELRTGAEQIPGAAAVPWYGLSHPARIVRWLCRKPPRVQTMLSVRAALGGGDDASMETISTRI
jgi:hypothetical protein